MSGSERRGKRAEREERREKREERREKREERREKREKRRDKREDRRQTPRGRQRSRNEAARGGPTLFYTIPPAKARSIDGSNRCILRVDRDCVERIHRAYAVAMALPSPRPQAGWPNAARREKREEGRQHRAASSIHYIFTLSRDHEKVERREQRDPTRPPEVPK